MSSPALFDLTGRVAVVTGGNGGIGLGIALGLAEAGAAVAILARNEEKSRSALEEVEARGARGLAIKVDVSNRTEIPPALARVEQALGPIHVLVNNAGIAIVKGVLEQSLDEWDQVIETNLNACFILSKLAAESMVRRKQGKIINIASEYSLFGSAMVPSYSAAKGALVQLTKSMAIELAPHNIQVNAIAPGWIESDLTQPLKQLPIYQQISADPGRSYGHA